MHFLPYTVHDDDVEEEIIIYLFIYLHMLNNYIYIHMLDNYRKPDKKCPKNMSEAVYRWVCLNARGIVNKKNELNIMVEDIDHHIIGITESWTNTNITDA